MPKVTQLRGRGAEVIWASELQAEPWCTMQGHSSPAQTCLCPPWHQLRGPGPRSAHSPAGLGAMVPGTAGEAPLGQRARVSSSHVRKVWAGDLTSSQASCLTSLGDEVNVSSVLANNQTHPQTQCRPPPGPSEEWPLRVPFLQPHVGKGSPPCPTASADPPLRTRQREAGRPLV